MLRAAIVVTQLRTSEIPNYTTSIKTNFINIAKLNHLKFTENTYITE
jgi:hypothetical protein